MKRLATHGLKLAQRSSKTGELNPKTEERGSKPKKPCTAEALTPRGQEIALAQYNHVEQQVALSATTAGLVVAADALIIRAFLTVAGDYGALQTPVPNLLNAGFGLAGALIVLGFFSALWAVLPKVSFKNPNPHDRLLFFNVAGKMDSESFVKAYVGRDKLAGCLDEELLLQIVGKCQWLRRRFIFLRIAVYLTIAGVLVTMAVAGAITVSNGGNTAGGSVRVSQQDDSERS